MVNGVAQVNVFGPQKYAVRIDVDPRKLSAHGIGIDEVVTAVQSSNVNLPTGTMSGRERIFTVLADGQLLNAASYAPMVIAYRNGNPIRLGDVARVYDGVEQDKTASWYQGQRNISLMIQKQPGSNVVQVVDDIKSAAPGHSRPASALGAARRQNGSLDVDSRIGPRREADAPHRARARHRHHLHLPAQLHGHDHPQPDAAGVAHRHLRGDVPAELQPRQPVADGADAVHRLRRRRHDRHAGKHRPAHGDGQAGHARGVRRRQGSRVHDRRDDRVARRRLHSRPVHGRHRRPPAAGIRRHDRRRHPRVVLRVNQPHADAVQPVPEDIARPEAWTPVQPDRADVRWVTACLRHHAAVRAQASRRHDGLLAAPGGGDGVSLHDRPEGLPAVGRSGTLPGERRGDSGYWLRRDGPPPAGGRGDSGEGPRHRGFQQQRWRWRRKKRRQLVESGPHQRRLEAA